MSSWVIRGLRTGLRTTGYPRRPETAAGVSPGLPDDGVYSADPKRDPSAQRYDVLTHDDAIAKNLAVMDTAAFALARENNIPIVVFSILEPGAIAGALAGDRRATFVIPKD